MDEAHALLASFDRDVAELYVMGKEEAHIRIGFGKRDDIHQPARGFRFGCCAVIDDHVFNFDAARKAYGILIIKIVGAIREHRNPLIAAGLQRAAAKATMPIPFGPEIRPEIDEAIDVARGVFDKQITDAGDRNVFETYRAVADIQIPAMEMHINTVETTVFDAEVLVEIGAENAPGHPTRFSRQIAERAIQQGCVVNAICALFEGFGFIGAVFFPGDVPDIF